MSFEATCWKAGGTISYYQDHLTKCGCAKITLMIQNWSGGECIPTVSLPSTYHFGQQMSPQAHIEVEGAPEYTVKEILDSQLWQNKMEFLIKWKDYTNENNLWEPKENCKWVHKAIAQFFKLNPNVPHHIVWIKGMAEDLCIYSENFWFRPHSPPPCLIW